MYIFPGMLRVSYSEYLLVCMILQDFIFELIQRILLLSNIVTLLILFEDSLFVYPLGNDCVKLRGTQFEKFSFGMPTPL